MAERLTDEQLGELLRLARQADSVELKLTVPDSEIRSSGQALGLDPLDSEIRQVVFFDTPDLALNEAGVVVRARRIQGGAGDTVVKLRPVVPDEIEAGLRDSEFFGVEVDAMPGGYVCSASFKGESSSADVRKVVLGERDVKSLFSKQQRAFFRDHAPDGVKLNDLAVLGPINLFKLKAVPEEVGRKVVAEMWLYPDGSRIFELSTKCAPNELFNVAAEMRVFLADHGVELGGQQQTKTKTALEYFAAQVAADRAAQPDG